MNVSRRGSRWLVSIIVLAAVAGCGQSQRRPAALYQVSTLQALMQGAYDGVVSFDQLGRYGDTGIGTLQSLDGEMVMVDGQAWQVRADGLVRRVCGHEMTPFATVAFFQPEKEVEVAGPVDLAGLGQALDARLATRNIFYMVRMDGRFAYVKTRSVPAQKQPYRLLLEACKEQSVFERRYVEGTLVALRTPEYAQGINMAGWHMHFLAKDRGFGGHVLELRLERGRAAVMPLRQFEMLLPSAGRFVEADLAGIRAEDIRKVEQ
jgi:acetolactate decarboxylase